MKTIRIFFVSLTLAFTASIAFAQGTGDFEIKENNFAALFNGVRLGQPEVTPWPSTFWPYSFHGTAAIIYNGEYAPFMTKGDSPMKKFDQIAGLSGQDQTAEKWEKENHTCDVLESDEDRKSCESWWGHCNGWAAAAIKEPEPRKPFTVGDVQLSTAEAKGILAEVWLSNNSLYAGDSDKGARIADGLKNGWIARPKDKRYQSFWDLSPRSFFLILTNYMGLNKIGLVIDRHPGDEVWNQPLVGYRILPISPYSITPMRHEGKQVWAVPMMMKIVWANDLEVSPGIVSPGFDIKKNTSDLEFEDSMPFAKNGNRAFEIRLLQFTLFFDGEVQVSNDGLKVLKAGRLVGDGVWKMQESPEDYSEADLSESHPDFVWLPTNSVLDNSGYGNPYMLEKAVRKFSMEHAKSHGDGPDSGGGGKEPKREPSRFDLIFEMESFDNLRSVEASSVRNKLKRIFSRHNVKVSIPTKMMEITEDSVKLRAEFPEGMTKDDLAALLEEAEMSVRRISLVR